jgi:hypothetical protein
MLDHLIVRQVHHVLRIQNKDVHVSCSSFVMVSSAHLMHIS